MKNKPFSQALVDKKMDKENRPKDKKRYSMLKQRAKKKFKWPSAYASMWLSKEYAKGAKDE